MRNRKDVFHGKAHLYELFGLVLLFLGLVRKAWLEGGVWKFSSLSI
ncbi:MAG: hypothetical protein Q4F41_03585 [Eubacteriales bacterium]|nr:hypothetical protein [Eubacteriales bacterium]